jgi:tripeptidyl-peptidase I
MAFVRYSPGSIHPGLSLGVILSTLATWLPEDLDAFFTRFQPHIVSKRPFALEALWRYSQATDQELLFNLDANLDHAYTIALTYL